MRPVDAITLEEAAAILGCSRSTVRRHVAAGRLPSYDRYAHRALARVDVEQLATQVYDWRAHAGDDTSYWVIGVAAAGPLGRPRAQVALG